MKRLIQGEEWSPLLIGAAHGLSSTGDVEALLTAWERKTGLSSSAFFERRYNSLVPKSWSGTIETPRFQLEVTPIGTASLCQSEKKLLDQSLSFMVAGALSSFAFTGLANVSITGQRHEALVAIFCDELLLARRRQVLRRYTSYFESLSTPKGRITFPAQCYEGIRRPSRFASTWVALSEDVPENRLFKETLRLYRPKCSPQLRGKIDLCLAELESIPAITDTRSERAKLREDKLPTCYKNLLIISRALLDGQGCGVFQGNIFASSQVIFTSRLFESFAANLFSTYAYQHGFFVKQHPRGAYLFHKEEGSGAFEQIPDILLSDSNGTNRVIIDTKWKNIKVDAKNFGINSNDMNQVLVYASKYECSDIVLLYPDISHETGNRGIIKDVSLNLGKHEFRLHVVKLPLLAEESGNIKVFIHNLLGKLKTISCTSA